MDAKEWLKNRLTLCGKKIACDIEDVRADARAEGITRAELKEARRTLGVKLIRGGNDGETLQWTLP